MAVFLSRTREETEAFGQQYAKHLKRGDTVLLEGEMGAGKTVLAKGIAKGLGIGCEVTSPTYALVNAYGDLLYHFDCYRIDEEKALLLGLADYFDLGGICLVEWSENIASLLPEGCARIEIVKRSENEREIRY